MTLERLNEHYDLLQKLHTAQESLAALRLAAEPGAQRLTGMPHATGVRDIVGALAVQIAMSRDRVKALEEKLAESEREVQAWLATLEDDYARTVISLRFLAGLQWQEVAAIVGGGNTESSVKMVCYRYLLEKSVS